MLKHIIIAVISNPNLPQVDVTNKDVAESLLQEVLQIIFVVLGSLAVFMVTVGGYMYITADAEPRKLKSAKDTILYAAIGLFVALGAWGIVTFVIDGLFK